MKQHQEGQVPDPWARTDSKTAMERAGEAKGPTEAQFYRRLLKGALWSPDGMVRFQFNPTEVTRNVTPSFYGGGQGQRVGTPRFSGAPTETISLEINLENLFGDLRGQLAALEIMAYPSLKSVESQEDSLATGLIEAVPLPAPTTLFVFGTRVIPVKIKSLEITEEFFDPNLNPIRAKVALNMDVLTYSGVQISSDAHAWFSGYQKSLEKLAAPELVTTVSAGTLHKLQEGQTLSRQEFSEFDSTSGAGE
ncbi:MAG: hypothetical protein ACE5GX_02460 [Thermoanaerobaculia bacterium]